MTIAGSDSAGGAGLQADLKTFLTCGVHGTCAITAVTVQNTVGVNGVHEIPAAVVAAQIETVAADLHVGAAKTGMIFSSAVMKAVGGAVRRARISPFVVDPVAASQHGEPLLHPSALDTLRTVLIPMADLVTPNLSEIHLLTGIRVRGPADIDDALAALLALGPRWALVKGGQLPHGDALDVLSDGTTRIEYRAARHPTLNTHGSGDTLGAAITAALAGGATMPDAVAAGKAFVTAAVADAFALGAGRGPVGHRWRVRPWPPQRSD